MFGLSKGLTEAHAAASSESRATASGSAQLEDALGHLGTVAAWHPMAFQNASQVGLHGHQRGCQRDERQGDSSCRRALEPLSAPGAVAGGL